MVQNTNQANDSLDKENLAQVSVYCLTGSRSMFFLINIFSADDRNSIKPTVGPPGLTLVVGLTCLAVPVITVDASRTYQGMASAAQAAGFPKQPPPQAVRQCYSTKMEPSCKWYNLTLAVGLTCSTVPAITVDDSRTYQGIASAAQAASFPKRPPPQAVRQYYSMTIKPNCKWYNLSNHMVQNTNQGSHPLQ